MKMNEDKYIKKIHRALWVIRSNKRNEIVREIKSEIDERKVAGEKIEDILKDMPSPSKLRREYVEIYGISVFTVFLLSLLACAISFLTLSIIPFTEQPFYSAPVFLIVLSLYIVYITYQFGKTPGLVASISSGIFRIALLYATIFLLKPPLEKGTGIIETITSIAIAIIPLLVKNKR